MVPSSDHPHRCHPHPHPHHHRARFPSLAEFPDSPSVYSYAHHSPDLDVHSDPASFSCLSDSPNCPGFDDEIASTIRSLATEDTRDDSDVDECTDDTSYRISLQGPKIRFHSRAPWETDDDILHAEEPSKSATLNKLRGKASRADSLIRTFTRGSSITSRPSLDSARSAASSFEITARNHSSSRGALYGIARQSTSTSSLASSSASVQNLARETKHPKSSHYFIQNHDPSSRATVSLDVVVPSAMTFGSAPTPPSCSDVSRVSHERNAKQSLAHLSQERQSHDQFLHPYANPDLVIPYTPSPETIPSLHPIFGDMCGSDSYSTITDTSSTKSAAFSVTSAETSTTSLTSRDTPHRNLRLNGKEISPPISVLHQSDSGYVDRSTRFLSLHPPPAGFEGPLQNNLNSRSPIVTLITLQEAQERERLRSNTVHSTVARSMLSIPSSDHIAEVVENRTVEVIRKTVHTRARSTSSGTRHKMVTYPPVQHRNTEIKDESSVSATPGRTLKHKKSGFMRLFGGRNSDGEKERSAPPPVPALSDVCIEESLETHGTGKTSKLTLSRAPKFPPSPTQQDSAIDDSTLASTHGGGTDERGSSSRRRQPPPLSIVTKTSDHSIPTSLPGEHLPIGLNFTPPPYFLSVPQSAPPGNSNFPGLKLRPISASFSSHFADMVTGAVEEPQYEVHTPSSAVSSNTALSPVTPASTRRSDDALTVEASGEEYLTVKGLQEQLVSAKKAWQQQIWELRGRVRDLTSELEDLRAADNQGHCEACGRGGPRKRYALPLDEYQPNKGGVVNRPRGRTGDTARFASGN